MQIILASSALDMTSITDDLVDVGNATAEGAGVLLAGILGILALTYGARALWVWWKQIGR